MGHWPATPPIWDCPSNSFPDVKPGSVGGLDVESLGHGRLFQTVVVGEQHPELGTDGQGRSQMDGVEGTQITLSEITGPVKQCLVEADEAQGGEQASASAPWV